MIQEQFAGAAAALYFIKLKDPEDPYCDREEQVSYEFSPIRKPPLIRRSVN